MKYLFMRHRTADITSYDLYKTFALITMLIDHVGSYLLQDILLFKALGRWSFPVWLFLIGFSDKREISKQLWVGMILVTLSYVVFHKDLWPLNILATIIFARLALPLITRKFFYTLLGLVLLIAVAICFLLPTYRFFEYGITGLLFAFWGHIRRHQRIEKWLEYMYAVVIYFLYATIQAIVYPFSPSEQQIVLLGIIAVMWGLYHFKPIVFENTKNYWFFSSFLRFSGRYTLEIYVVHVIIFTAISAYLYADLIQLDFFGLQIPFPISEFSRQ